MLPLTIEKTYRVLLRQTKAIHIILVGLGGTGSHLAWALARLAATLCKKQGSLQLTFIDHDNVEAKNIGRQYFHSQQLGYNKAKALAWQLNATYGLDIVAIPYPFTAAGPTQWNLDLRTNADQTLLIGCVDNHVARQALADTVARHSRLWWLDCGNTQFSGQVLIGNTTQLSAAALNDDLRLCRDLPAPHIQAPELLEPDPNHEQHSCTELVLQEEQSLFVNQMAATIAAHYASQFSLHRELTTFATHFTLTPAATTNSQHITKTNLSPFIPAVSSGRAGTS